MILVHSPALTAGSLGLPPCADFLSARLRFPIFLRLSPSLHLSLRPYKEGCFDPGGRRDVEESTTASDFHSQMEQA